MERNHVAIKKQSFKCDACGVYNKIGASKCWKCGKSFYIEKASEAQLLTHARAMQKDAGKRRATPLSRVQTLLLFLLPPAGIALLWLKRDSGIRSKITGTAASLAWTALVCLMLFIGLGDLDLSFMGFLPADQSAPKPTAFVSNQGYQGRAADSNPLNASDAVRIRVNDRLGARNQAGLDRVVGVSGMHVAINADGDPLMPDHRALREQLLTIMPAIADIYRDMGVHEPFKAVLYLVGDNTRGIPVELDALTAHIDADTVLNTDWNAVETDWLHEFIDITEKVLAEDEH